MHSCGNQTLLQPALLQLASLRQVEISPWTDLEQTLHNVPPEKELVIFLHANDVLFADQAQMEGQLRLIVDLCAGRRYRVNTSGLTPAGPDPRPFPDKIRRWTAAARKVLL